MANESTAPDTKGATTDDESTTNHEYEPRPGGDWVDEKFLSSGRYDY